MITKLNEGNSIKNIYSLVDYLPKPSGGRNLDKVIHKLKDQVLTTDAGDRWEAPNICIFITCLDRSWVNKLKRKLGEACDRIIILNQGYLSDLFSIQDQVCSVSDYVGGM